MPNSRTPSQSQGQQVSESARRAAHRGSCRSAPSHGAILWRASNRPMGMDKPGVLTEARGDMVHIHIHVRPMERT